MIYTPEQSRSLTLVLFKSKPFMNMIEKNDTHYFVVRQEIWDVELKGKDPKRWTDSTKQLIKEGLIDIGQDPHAIFPDLY